MRPRPRWEWDGADWTQRAAPAAGIGAGGAACFDSVQRGVFYNLASVNRLWEAVA